MVMIKKVYVQSKRLHVFIIYAKSLLSNLCINYKYMEGTKT